MSQRRQHFERQNGQLRGRVITLALVAIAAFAMGAFSGYNVSSGRKGEE